jgi:hypothetical protein
MGPGAYGMCQNVSTPSMQVVVREGIKAPERALPPDNVDFQSACEDVSNGPQVKLVRYILEPPALLPAVTLSAHAVCLYASVVSSAWTTIL